MRWSLTHQYERREGLKYVWFRDFSMHLPHARGVSHKVQAIVSRDTGQKVSAEILIDAPPDDIKKYLSHTDVSFDIFLSQLIEAFQSGEHRHVNIELVDLMRPNFIEFLKPILSQFRRKNDRNRVVIEITERWKVEDVFHPMTKVNLQFLKREGFSLFVDDYDLEWSLSNNVSRMIYQRFRGILSGVKIPHEFRDLLLEEHWQNTAKRMHALSSIAASSIIIAEWNGLYHRRGYLPRKIHALQDPLYS
jgi:hypothetical protein